MINFTFSSPTQVVFGKETEKEVGKLVSTFAKKVLLHYGGGSIKKNGLYDKVIDSLKQESIEFVELGGVVPNPRYSLVLEGIKSCKDNSVDAIVAVGGGSVIDSAKAIAAGVYMEDGEDLWEDYFMGKKRAKNALPLGVVLTIPAAGSETNGGTVISNDFEKFKRSTGSPCMVPRFAIINPEYHFTLPNFHTSCGCADILAHLMERYFTQTTSVDYSDRLLEASMKTIIHYAPLAIKNSNDYDIRAEIAWCGTIAHNGVLGRGRVEDWATHDLQHELGAIYDIIHGEGLAIMFPAWMKYVWKENPKRFIQFAQRVWGVDFATEKEEYIILEGIRRLEVFFTEIGLSTRLSQLDIDDSRIEEMANKLLVNREYAGNFKKLNVQDAIEIYRLAL